MDVLSVVFIFVIFTIGFGLGGSITVEEMHGAITNYVAILVGMTSQFFFMPLCCYLISTALQLGELEAAGLILCGCAPGGGGSNLFCLWSKGDVSLSIVMTTMSTIFSCIMFPLNVFIYVKTAIDAKSVELDYAALFTSLGIMLFGTGCGMFLSHYHREKRPWVKEWVEGVGSTLGGIFILIAIVVSVVNEYHLVYSGWKLWVGSFLMMPLGFGFGFGMAYLLGLPLRQRIAISLETAIQNLGLIIAIIKFTFDEDQQDIILRFPLFVAFAYVFWVLGFIAVVRLCITHDEESITMEGVQMSTQKCNDSEDEFSEYHFKKRELDHSSEALYTSI